MAAPRAWRSALARAACASVALLAVACSDDIIAPAAQLPSPESPGAGGPSQELTCVASVRAATITCQTPAPSAGGASAVIFGGQNSYVRMISSNTAMDAGTGVFSADVAVQNLLPQTIGSTDGVTVDPKGIQVFYASGPNVTAGSGSVEVANEDGTGQFLGEDTKYYQYQQLLASGATSATKPWRWNVAAGVESFTFKVYVSTVVTPSLIITEVMPNPGAADDVDGEFIEVYNPGIAPVDLNGFRFNSRTGASGVETSTVATSVIVAPRGYAVIGARVDSAFNGGIKVAHAWGTSINLSNSASATAPDYIKVSRPGVGAGTFVTLDSVAWTAGGGTSNVATPPTARSRELTDLKADNSVLNNNAVWNTAYTTFGYGDGNGGFDRGTPGKANGVAVPTGPVAVVRISPGFAVIDSLNQSRTFTATAEDTLGQASPTTITWASLNPAIATIASNGRVTHVDTGGVYITATASNGKADTTYYRIFKYSPAAIYRNHVEFGIPVTGMPQNNDNILILSDRRTQYNLSYNASRGGPNWVSWNVNRTQFGNAPRGAFGNNSVDPLLPAYGVYQVTTCDYTNSGYTRGHMTQSEQRTQSKADNDTTFLMTNILPQTSELNTGPWGDLEEYGNDLARFQQKELYNVAGGTWPATPRYLTPFSTSCTPQQNKVQIPTTTWKVIVVLPYGKGLADVTSANDVRIIAVDMPNNTTVNNQPWQYYKVTVDQIEAITGYDLLAALPDAIESVVEARIDP
ncbi:DNA/RNA non-specific endonuclease [Longimicrobium terrae]|uniref:DNA/RNA endonuclease G (NUC1) n=1 Tax=Longimicrobium terrae TaxID=1639882 RepID=A0A841H3P4_9BACT|nr:DNA/RNA non-specific endonuclease [Longimicrobium terrae]MBB4638339.1 DNA/RNA endonuclease G (NUC1) [Longimicrobium terrae]MBB6072593.1 DNA/RNA endonuclease G (NUC1) [Longimicrobium terrae]NNC28628.1 hypothetical protein [Longimicrobium terrae]